MIANPLVFLIGLWLAYSAIFSTPSGDMSNIGLAASAASIVALAAWARQSDRLRWQSATNIVLGAGLLLLAALRVAVSVQPLLLFWLILLAGIAVAIAALWSLLYRPDAVQPG